MTIRNALATLVACALLLGSKLRDNCKDTLV